MPSRTLQRFLAQTAGTSAVEFAILAPVFIILLVAGVAFGQGFYAIGSVQWAVEQTARDLMIDGSLSEAQYEARVREIARAFTGMDFYVSYTTQNYGEIEVMQVRTILRYPVRIPLMDPVWLTYPVETYAPRPVG